MGIMRSAIIPLLLTLVALLPSAKAADLLLSAGDVRTAAYGLLPKERDFALTATVTFTRQEDGGLLFAVKDETGDVVLSCNPSTPILPRPGMRIKATGHTSTFAPLRQSAVVDSLTPLGEGPVPQPTPVSGPDLFSGHFDCQLTRITGIVRDVTRSELHARYVFLVVNCQGRKVYLSTPASKESFDRLKKLVDTEIVADGISLPFDCSFRANMGRIFKVSGTKAIRPLKARTPSDGQLPDIATIGTAGPSDIAQLGRHRAIGRIIAAWGGNQALLRTADGRLCQLEFDPEIPPSYGDFIEARGLPETDLFQVNLMHATWQRLPSEKMPDDAPQAVAADVITSVSNGVLHVDRHFHGQAVQIRGRIVGLPAAGSPDRRLYLESGKQLVSVEAEVLRERLSDVPVGSQVEISGTCIMEVETWRPNMIFTKTKGFILVTRTPDDIRVLARPSWWTPARLTAVIGALFVLLLAILAWNISLRRLSDRKGRALAKATLEQSETALKVQERTRLATELHDSIVQNLTGASLHLRTADKLHASDPAAMREQMSVALKTLDSCRDEIRNCIWDLRNRALDEPYMDDAIRRTLAPHTDGVKLAVRFAVPRNRLTDNTAHSIICIIRELVLNALRHGQATAIQVAGCLDGGQLLFSVKDNGTGFDADTAPGIEQGHFGLQGIRERVGLLQGETVITSRPDEGTKVSVSVRMPEEGKQ